MIKIIFRNTDHEKRTRAELMRPFLQKMKMKTPKLQSEEEYGSGGGHRGWRLRGYISIVCCFVVAMPSGKRETERKFNAPVDTGPSPNSDERVNNPTEGADGLLGVAARYNIFK
ncbi:hypothetical protein T03_7320 [Trichinella britovi]|uniref:Uncharacterized protein n=1 Tax=Trichinella britovi TaxID=45882 RepID=A0A0V1C9J0_TRIBR|nr:hypothetical protein T03_7320 [Trichinella britovi]